MRAQLVYLLAAASALAACETAHAAQAGPKDETSAQAVTAAKSDVVATTSAGPITAAELDRAIASRPKLARQIYDIRHDALEGMILQRLVEAEAAQRKITPEQLVAEEVGKGATTPTDAEIKKFYDEQVASSGYKLEDVKGQIVQHLAAERRKSTLIAFVEGLKKKAQVKILLKPPRAEVEARGPSKGAENAPVTIVEFSDFQCPYCQRQEEALHKILAEYPGRVRLVFRDFPLDIHPNAQKAAQAAACADDQGKFWPMHDKLFENQGALEADKLKAYARQAGLDGKQFDTCLDKDATKERVEKSLMEGEHAGVDGTPALFVNGRLLSGATSYEDLKSAVDDELAGGGQGAGK
jgi:protein-disulfide isomerase